MAGTIYQTMRKYDKSLHTYGNKVRAQAERSAEVAAERRGDITQQLRVPGVKVKLHGDIAQHAAIEAREGLIPWNGQEDNLIDRFDGRALLDFYRDPVKRPEAAKNDEEYDLEQKLNFEAYRDLISLLKRKIPEEKGLLAVEKREMELRANKEYERTHGVKGNQVKEAQQARAESVAAGNFSAIGFAYQGPSPEASHTPYLPLPKNLSGEAKLDDDSVNSDDSDSESDYDLSASESDSSDESDGPENEKDLETEQLAKEYDIKHFARMVRKAKREKRDADSAPIQGKTPPVNTRRQRRATIKTLRAQGITDKEAIRSAMAAPKKRDISYAAAGPPPPSYRRRASPTYDTYRRRSPSPSRQSRRHPDSELPARREYISSFDMEADAQDSEDDERRDRNRRTRDRANNKDEAAPARAEPILEAHHRDPAMDPHQVGRDSSVPGPLNCRSGSKPVAAGRLPSALKGGLAEKKETPMERLKRLTAARLNKQLTKDVQAETSKLRTAEKEREFKNDLLRQARDAERRARSRSRSRTPPRASTRRSRSPPRRVRSPHSRSRSRSPAGYSHHHHSTSRRWGLSAHRNIIRLNIVDAQQDDATAFAVNSKTRDDNLINRYGPRA